MKPVAGNRGNPYTKEGNLGRMTNLGEETRCSGWLLAQQVSLKASMCLSSRAKQPGIADIPGGAGLLGSPGGLADRGSEGSGEEWSGVKAEIACTCQPGKCLHLGDIKVIYEGSSIKVPSAGSCFFLGGMMTGAELAGSCSLLWVPALHSEPFLARGTRVPTTSKDTSDAFLPSHPSPLWCQQSCPPFPGLSTLGIPGEGSCGASALASPTIIQGNGLGW